MAKRGQGEGSYREIRPGLWQGRIGFVDPITGKYTRKSVYGRTRKEARDKVEALLARVRAGGPATDATETVGAWCTRWVTGSLPASRLKESTQLSYESVVRRQVLRAPIAQVSMRKLKPSDIDAWILWMREARDDRGRRAVAETTVRRAFYVLRKALQGAVRDGIIAANPLARVDPPVARAPEADHFTVREVADILDSARDTYLYPLLLAVASTGARRSELLGLRWQNIDVENNSIHILSALNATRDGLVLADLKTQGSRRRVPVPQEVIDALVALRQVTAQGFLGIARVVGDDEYVFQRRDGRPLSFDTVNRHLNVVAQAAGVGRRVGLHMFRHSAATRWLDGGLNPRATSELLGHASTRITMDIYGHRTRYADEQAVQITRAAVIDIRSARSAAPRPEQSEASG